MDWKRAGLRRLTLPELNDFYNGRKKDAARQRTQHLLQQARLTYGDTVAAVDVQRLTYVDEADINLALTRLYGRPPAGARAVGNVPSNYGPNVTLLGALGTSGLEALMTIESATDGAVFRTFVEQILAQRRKPEISWSRTTCAPTKSPALRPPSQAMGRGCSISPVCTRPVTH
jgi:hypothetical protein